MTDSDDDEGSSTGAVIAIIIVVCLGIVVAALLWVFRERLCKNNNNVKKYNQTTLDPDESARDPSVDRPLKATFEDPEKKSDDIEIGSDDSKAREKDMQLA